MWESIAALQSLVIAVVLLVAARVKLFGRDGGKRGKAALEPLLGARLASGAYRMVGVIETAIVLMMLIPPLWTIGWIGVFALSMGYLGYLRHSARTKPDTGCGCLGTTAVPISWRTYTRAASLGVLAVAAATASVSWLAAVTAAPLASTSLVLVELAFFTAVSPEFDRLWPAARARLLRPTEYNVDTVLPLPGSLSRLHASDVYRESAEWLHAEVTEFWDETDWRFICYDARYRERDCTAVFAIPLPHNDIDLIKLAVVDESTGQTLFSAPEQQADGFAPTTVPLR